MKVRIEEDERYPDYSVRVVSDWKLARLTPHSLAQLREVDQETYDRWSRVMADYEALQDELEELA